MRKSSVVLLSDHYLPDDVVCTVLILCECLRNEDSRKAKSKHK